MTNGKIKKNTIVKTVYDEYKVIEQIGSGGNGRVFSASNENGEIVAIKFVDRTIVNNKLKRLKNEIAFCEQHNHKNIVRILDKGCLCLGEIEYVFYVMPLYKETLRSKINNNVSPDDAVNIFVGILEGLEYAHNNGVIHRDIKPENILFEEGSNEPIICDFGIAHFSEENLLTLVETKPTERLANFSYAAPEQYRQGAEVSYQTDIYSAALILNEMFTTEIPKAVGYKKIGDINPNYIYLDEVFEQIYKQNPKERLYPEENILLEMKIRAEEHKLEQEKQKFKNIIISNSIKEKFEINIVKKDYVNNKLILKLSRNMPKEWFAILSSGNFGSYSELLGYGPSKIFYEDKNLISMQLKPYIDVKSIKIIVRNLYDWIEKTNCKYTEYIAQVRLNEQKREEQIRKDEIKKIEKEIDILAALQEI